MRLLTVRTQRGVLHVAIARGRTYLAACRRVLDAPDLVVYEGRKSQLAWQNEVLCTMCEERAEAARSPRDLARLARW